MSKLSQIEQKIKEVCPWLMKLEFGCEVRKKDTGDGRDRAAGKQGKIVYIYRHERPNAQAFHAYFDGNKTHSIVFDYELEILGKEPQLSDLLYTIEKNTPDYSMGTDGRLAYCNWVLNEKGYTIVYDLTKSLRENLENEELCDFIHQLICK